MNQQIYTKIDRKLMQLDPEFSSRSQLRHLAWARSSLTIHQQALPKRQRKILKAGQLLLNFRKNLLSLKKEPPSYRPTRPQLKRPSAPTRGSYRPARYFSRGALDNDRKKNPTPIPYLLTETNEISKSRPVPGNSLILRSLCKGTGVLKQNKQGLVYLDIDNRFILSLIPYLKAFHLVRPPYFNLFSAPEGAHIPIISAREAALHYIGQVHEIDKKFSFEIEGLYSVEPTLWPEVEQVWFFKLSAPELEAFRRRHFLFSNPGGHSFHIAVAVKPRIIAKETAPKLPIMRINIAYLAA